MTYLYSSKGIGGDNWCTGDVASLGQPFARVAANP
jgi:hypothetical protein